MRKTKGVAVDIYQVLMLPDTYPKIG